MAKKDAATFEENLEHAEDIARKIEDGSLSLDKSLEQYEEGVKALKACYEILRKAEKKIEALVKDNEGVLKAEDFEADTGNAESNA